IYRPPYVVGVPSARVVTYCRLSTECEYVGSTDACHCDAGRMLTPALRSHRQPSNSSLKYCVRAVHVFATLGRLVTCVVSTYAFGVPMSGPPRVRSSLNERRWTWTPPVQRQKLWNVSWKFSLKRRYCWIPP